MSEVVNAAKIGAVWKAHEQALGASHAGQFAQDLATAFPHLRFSPTALAHDILRLPTETHVYPGAKETLQQLIGQGDRVVIWTQGEKHMQLWKVATSGLGEIRRGLPRDQRSEFTCFTDTDKVTCLPETVQRFRKPEHNQVTIVDDKSENILRLRERVAEWQADGTYPADLQVNLVWINQGRTKDTVPEGYTVEQFRQEFATIEDIKDLAKVPGEPGKNLWFIDYDHTLVHTNGWREEIFQRLEEDLADGSYDSIICPILDKKAGLNGHNHVKDEFKSGMSGADRIVRVGNGKVEEDVVAKYNPGNKEKIRREVRGFKVLQETPLAPHLIPPKKRFRTSWITPLPLLSWYPSS